MAEKGRALIGNGIRYGLPAVLALGLGAYGLNAANSEEAAEPYIDPNGQTIEVPAGHDGFDAVPLGVVAAAVQGAIDSSAQELLIEHIEDEESNPGCEVIEVENAGVTADMPTSPEITASENNAGVIGDDETAEDSTLNQPSQRLVIGCDNPTIIVPSEIDYQTN